MNLTYVPGRELIILCTRRDTKKFAKITSNPLVAIFCLGRYTVLNLIFLMRLYVQVAVLVHDFPHMRVGTESIEQSHGKTWSV